LVASTYGKKSNQSARDRCRITHSKRWRFGAWTTPRAKRISGPEKFRSSPQEDLLQQISANSCRSRTSGANLKAFLVRDSQLSKASLSFRGHRNSRQRASTTTVRTTRSQKVFFSPLRSLQNFRCQKTAPDPRPRSDHRAETTQIEYYKSGRLLDFFSSSINRFAFRRSGVENPSTNLP
jgi:hypothetical protein